MSEATTTSKKRPDYLAFAVRPNGNGPRYTRIGVAFANKNGGYSVFYDAVPLSGQIVLIGFDEDKPSQLSYGAPSRKADFEASMVREAAANNSFWTNVGLAYRQEGYLSIYLDVVPTGGKLVLNVPREGE